MSEPTMTPGEPLVARDPDEVLPPRRRRKLRPLTAVLAALVLVGAGFAGGIQTQKHYGGSSSTSLASARSAFAARFGAGRTSAGGAASFFGQPAATGGTQEVGQVTVIKGSTIYLADFLGNTLRIQIPATTKVSETSQLTVKGIHPGDTVTAQVTKLPSGDYKATAVTVTPST
jgi:hypothetical protein